MAESLMLNFPSPCQRYLLTFEENEKVAYAYVRDNERDKAIVGAVWLYNRCPTPDISEWRDKANIPFANVKGYMHEAGRLTRNVGVEDVQVGWEEDEGKTVAYVYVFEDLSMG